MTEFEVGVMSASLVMLLSLLLGYCALALHGLLLWRRSQPPPLADCMPVGGRRWLAMLLLAFVLLSRTELDQLPQLSIAPLLLAVAPALLRAFGPPQAHIERLRHCQIGTGFAWSHYYGYLRLMRGLSSVRKRLQDYRNGHERFRTLYTDAVIVLVPADGCYPDDGYSQLEGVEDELGAVPEFSQNVGGNERSYGRFGVHRVCSADGKRSELVALDKVGALGSLRKLRRHGPAGLSAADFEDQMVQMLDTLGAIVNERDNLRGQLRLVSYRPGDHVGERILSALDSPPEQGRTVRQFQ